MGIVIFFSNHNEFVCAQIITQFNNNKKKKKKKGEKRMKTRMLSEFR